MIPIVNTLVRHFLTMVAGGLIADGAVSDAQIQTISGAVLTVAVIMWSIIEKKYFTNK